MGNIPGSSKRCKECRIRRVKCGLEQPSCTRCLKSGIRCSGPTTGPTFIRRDASNIQTESDREILISAIRNKSAPPTRLRLQDTSRAINGTAPLCLPRPTDPLSSLCSFSIWMDLYRSVVDDYALLSRDQNSNREGAIQSSVSKCATEILQLAFRNRALDASLFASSVMYMSVVQGDAGLQEVALSSYSTALRYFRSEVVRDCESQAGQMKQKRLLMSINMALLFFEWLAYGPTGSGYTGHFNGALSIIQNSDPKIFQSPLTRSIFTTVRCIALWHGFKERKAVFLASEPWITVPYEKLVKDFRELLFDDLLRIPGLLQSADRIKILHAMEQYTTPDLPSQLYCRLGSHYCDESIKFLQTCDSVARNLNAWLDLLHQSQKGPIWWYTNTSNLSKQTHSTGEISTEAANSQDCSFIRFSSPGISGLMEIYWAGFLELSRTIFEIRNLLANNTHHVACLSVLGSHSPSLLMDESRSSKLALRICQNAIELSLSVEGSSIAYHAVTLADDYFRQLLQSNSPLDENTTPPSHRLKRYEVARIGLECSLLSIHPQSGPVAAGLIKHERVESEALPGRGHAEICTSYSPAYEAYNTDANISSSTFYRWRVDPEELSQLRRDGQRPVCQNCLRGDRTCVSENAGIKFVIHTTDPAPTKLNLSSEESCGLQTFTTSPKLSASIFTRGEYPESVVYNLILSDPRSALDNQDIAKIFRHYIDVLAPWYDLNDSDNSFGIIVPSHALDNPILFKALIAFSAHHRSMVTGEAHGLGLTFHAACVEDLLKVMDNFQLRLRADYLAATYLLRSYEILTGDSRKEQKHLLGAYLFSTREPIDMNKSGLAQAGAWNYLGEEITVALECQRPTRIGIDFDFDATEHYTDKNHSLQQRQKEWQSLRKQLAIWKEHLPTSFELYSTAAKLDNPFPSLWLLQPWHVAGQQYCAITEILLAIYDPFSPVDQEFVLNQTLKVCGLAYTNDSIAARVNTFGPLAFCGRYLTSSLHREGLKSMLREFAKPTAWPVHCIINDLEEYWSLES
ncbi:hypothetical protein B7463_g4227, partial [Scytalidium lignicola]